MSQQCIIPGCNSTELTKTLFNLPKDDFLLLEKWSQEISFVNFQKIDLQDKMICEDHFKEEDITTESHTKVLRSNAIPSVFNYAAIVSSNSCRFCLRNCGSAERVDINDEVRKNCENLLDMKWLEHEDLPKLSCKSCAERLEASIGFKNQITKVHNVLEKLLKEKSLSEIKQEVEEINFLSDLATDECPCEVNIKSENSMSSSNGSDEFSEIENDGKNKTSKVILEDAMNYSCRFLKGKKKFFCGMCNDVFSSKSDLTAHMQFSHFDGEKIINCGVCAKKFSSRANLVKHMKESHLDSDVEDPEPNRKSFKRYNNHFKCKICQKSNFASLESLRRHHQVFHSNDANKRKRILDREKNRQQFLSQKTNCTICGKSVSKRYIRAHHQRYHEDNSRKLICDFCGKRQFNKQEMTFHMETNHMERQLLKCPHCDFKCHLKNYMKEHVNNIHLNKGLVCELCGQSVANKYKLVNHLRVWHTGEKPYKCKIPGCDKTFANSARRGEHIKSVHLIQPSMCKICGKDFSTQVSLNRHYHTVHSEKKIVCTYEGCNLRFTTNSKMLIHLASHTGIKKWNCQYCPHTNVTKSGLKRHLRDVHMNIVINCELCDFTTGRKETYRKHVKAKHLDIGEDRFKQLLIRIRDIPLPKTELDQ